MTLKLPESPTSWKQKIKEWEVAQGIFTVPRDFRGYWVSHCFVLFCLPTMKYTLFFYMFEINPFIYQSK